MKTQQNGIILSTLHFPLTYFIVSHTSDEVKLPCRINSHSPWISEATPPTRWLVSRPKQQVRFGLATLFSNNIPAPDILGRRTVELRLPRGRRGARYICRR